MEKIKAVILAAGESSRFYPYNTKHKSLIKIAGEEIIVRTVKSVKNSGIEDIILVVSNKKDFQDCLGDGSSLGVKITYVIQEKPEGMGEALLLARDNLGFEFFVLNCNHIEFEDLKQEIDAKRDGKSIVLLGRQSSGKHLGALKIDGDKVLRVVEKPESIEGFSDLKIVGVYFLNQKFLDALKEVKKEHYSFEAALDKCAEGGFVKIAETKKTVLSLKYPWHLFGIKNYIFSTLESKRSESAQISKHSIIEGEVIIEEGVKVLENATIKGPCYIGKNAFVGSNSLVRNGTCIEDDSVVGSFMEVKNSLIMSNSKTHSGHLEDSIVGENSRIGARFTSSNVRLDRSNIPSIVKGQKIDTGLGSLGVIMGSNTQVGTNVTIMPGVIIGNNVSIGPSTTVMKNIDSDTSYYTDFNEIIEKKK